MSVTFVRNVANPSLLEVRLQGEDHAKVKDLRDSVYALFRERNWMKPDIGYVGASTKQTCTLMVVFAPPPAEELERRFQAMETHARQYLAARSISL